LFPDNIQYNLDNEQAGTQTMLAFKVEHSKVPEFFGQKNKDTITVIIFIWRIDAAASIWRKVSLNNAMQFFKMQLFFAALPGEIRLIVAQKDQTNITLDDMYQIATTVQRERVAPIPQSCVAASGDKMSSYGVLEVDLII